MLETPRWKGGECTSVTGLCGEQAAKGYRCEGGACSGPPPSVHGRVAPLTFSPVLDNARFLSLSSSKYYIKDYGFLRGVIDFRAFLA